MEFSSTHIVIAGGTSGIGRQIAAAASAAGARVTVTGRSPQRLARMAEDYPSIGGAQVDATDRAALDTFFSKVGTVNHLVICVTGGFGVGPFASLDLDRLREAFGAKTLAQLQVVQAALPHLRPVGSEPGSITLITAGSAQAALPGTVGLAAVNGALEVALRPLAAELAPIRVNAVSPGIIDTPGWETVPAAERERLFADVAGRLPTGRVGRPEEIADLVMALIRNGYITGHTIVADGGLHLARG